MLGRVGLWLLRALLGDVLQHHVHVVVKPCRRAGWMSVARGARAPRRKGATAPFSVPTSSLSPFISTHILEPMHLSMSSGREARKRSAAAHTPPGAMERAALTEGQDL